jgi:flagellin-specific chaperone FliS
MRGFQAYQEQKAATPSRIEVILALYSRALLNLDLAEDALEHGHETIALGRLAETQIIVTGLAAGLDGRDETSLNFVRLYEFVSHQLMTATEENVRSARRVLTTLREGFEAVQTQALQLERQGVIPPLGSDRAIQVTA